ncbi:JmjC domain-containing protein [Nocardioides donggukensis]|uniref:JmjC domain-containing protein n=1 Tax=Nocardioides donggukensis TaxID=2774019 RepID=UPI00191F406B|nr:cupin domain-containing protein [Nocardioides donggukensis]
MHQHRTDPSRLTALLSLDDVDHLLTSTALRTPAIRVARDGSVLAESAYTRRGATLAGRPLTGLVDARRALELFEQGGTIVLQGLHRYWQPLTDLVAELEAELGHPCQANAYLTPPGSQGFAVHSDGHDVFVFQTHGTKLWEVHGEDGAESVLLEPGLSMYLPTGTPHAARTQDTASLHVTIGINQRTWKGLVQRTLRQVVDAVDDGHLPAGYPDEPDLLTEGLADRLQALADAVRAVDVPAAARAESERFLTERPTRQRGGLKDVLAVRTLSDDSLLRRRPGHPCVLVDDGDRVRVLLGDRQLAVPGWLRPALERVRADPTLRPGDLPLDEQSRLVLCRRLVREGLLEVVG